VNNPVVAQGTAITGYQFLAKDTGGTAVGAAYALQTSGGTDKWRWGLRGSAGSLTDSLIFSSLSGSWADVLTLSNAGVVSISSTTASTTTSTGALVVGNGTSGGLGVGGSIYAGGSLTLAGTASSIATSSADSMARIGLGLFTKDQAVTIGLSRRANYGDALIARNLQGQSGTDAYITSETTAGGGYGGFEIQHAGVARILVGSGATTANAVVTPTVAASFTTTTAAVSTVLQVINSTASTSTSSGALVVSGGVGVAGAINVGGNLGVTGTITVSGDQNSFFSGSWPRMFFETNGSSKWISGATTGASTVQHDFQNRSTTSLLTLYGTGNAIFAGNIKTAAPAGGTAAEWKLGTVASVSPTSPNRTIEVEIGGTTYYLHAKTTNN
jgi:hypothetical protein